MKNMFRKALTVLGSVAMIGATVGAASAAAYPAPFTSNTAIIVGANAAPSDSIAAASIAADLNAASVGTSVSSTTTVSGGDSYKFEKTSTKFHLGDAITDVVASALGADEMPVLLADGKYLDDNNDEFDYTQTITMDPASTLTQFTDNDYKEDTPTVGFKIPSGDTVLTYTLTFNDEPLYADMETTDLTLMGKTYYVLDASNNHLTLLDSADSTIVAEGETASMTAGGHTYSVSVEFIDSTSAKLKINGETTNKLAAGQTYKLSDGSYVGVKEVLYSAKDTGISKVEFSIGNGKLVLDDGQEVEMNDDTINGLTASVTGTTNLQSVSLQWDAEDDLFITKDSQITMPGFKAVQLAFGGLHFPSKETIKVTNKGDDTMILDNFPTVAGESDIALMYGNGTGYIGLGENADKALLTDEDGLGNITFDKAASTGAYFIASYSDGRDSESYVMRATNFKTDNTVDKVTFQYQKGGIWTDAKVDRKAGDTFSLGSVEFQVGAVDNSADTVELMLTNTPEASFNTLYSKDGMTVRLPWNNATGAGSINLALVPDTYNLLFSEEDKDNNLGDGQDITVVLGMNGQSTPQAEVSSYSVSGSNNAGAQEVDNSDVYSDIVYSALATEISNDKGPDQHTLTLTYHGDEATADVYITSADTTFNGGQAGVMTYTDSEVSKAAGMNLIVVGGSAINSVAAELLGGAYSEAAFTTATGVASGEFLIQSFNRAGKTALLVAGYNAADTTKAATYLVNNAVDTAVGNKYKGTSATEASLVVA